MSARPIPASWAPGIDGHGADPGDRRALVDERATEDLPVALGDQPGETVVGDHLRDLEAGELARRRLDRQVVAGPRSRRTRP
jgi:hypothetical protein